MAAAGIMSGSVVFNGQARSQSFWDNSAYVKQDDVHIPTLTVFETLTFAARLRLGNVSTPKCGRVFLDHSPVGRFDSADGPYRGWW